MRSPRDFFKPLALLSLTALGLATPLDHTGTALEIRHSPCLNHGDVDKLVDAYKRIISNWNDADAKYLASDFRDTSDSINILAGIPLGSATFPSKDAFLEHMHTNVRFSPKAQPPNPPPTLFIPQTNTP